MEDPMEERSSLFGIQPVVKRTYTKSGKYNKAAAKPKRTPPSSRWPAMPSYATRSSWTYERGPAMFDTGSLPIYVRPGYTNYYPIC